MEPIERGLKVKALRQSASYLTAYQDLAFLQREDLRPIRLQLELLKPELLQREHHIHSTIVVFGSARIVEPKEARRQLGEARARLAAAPRHPERRAEVRRAERVLANARYYEETRRFAQIVSQRGQRDHRREFVIVTGGGPGIMEAANRGAHDVKAKSIGLNITLPFEQEPNPYITPELCFQFHYFAVRKMHFLLRAKALVAFPGGYGTLDELFEALTLIQTRKMPPIPVLLFGKEYWDRVLHFHVFVEEGMITPEDTEIFRFVDSAEEAWAVIQEFYKKGPRRRRR